MNDTNSRPSTSSSSGCIATVNDGLWTTVGEAAVAFQSFTREFAERLLIFLFFLRHPGDDVRVDVADVGVTDAFLGVAVLHFCTLGVTLTLWFPSLGSAHGLFWTSTSSPRACLPVPYRAYSSLLEGVNMMGFRTTLVSFSFGRETGAFGVTVL